TDLEQRVAAERVDEVLALVRLELAVAVRVEVLLQAVAERLADAAPEIDRRRRIEARVACFVGCASDVAVGRDTVRRRVFGGAALGSDRLTGDGGVVVVVLRARGASRSGDGGDE